MINVFLVIRVCNEKVSNYMAAVIHATPFEKQLSDEKKIKAYITCINWKLPFITNTEWIHEKLDMKLNAVEQRL